LELKKLLFWNKRSRPKKIFIIGNSFFCFAVAYILKKRGIDFKFIYNDTEDIAYFGENFYIPVDVMQELDLRYATDDIRFTYYSDGINFPVSNYLPFFKENSLAIFQNHSEFEKFEIFMNQKFTLNTNFKKFFDQNFTNEFKNLLYSILTFYLSENFDKLGVRDIQNIFRDFFSEHTLMTEERQQLFMQEYIKNNHLIKLNDKRHLIVKNSTIILPDKIEIFDILFTDNLAFLKPKSIIEKEEKNIEFKIKKDYTNEYFPKAMILFDNRDFLELKDYGADNEFRYFNLSKGDNLEYIYTFFKNYFPELINEDIFTTSENVFIYKNFKFASEKIVFPFYSKIREISKFIDKLTK